jgi:hypothetical protein
VTKNFQLSAAESLSGKSSEVLESKAEACFFKPEA